VWYSFCCSLGNWILDVYYVFGACTFCNKTCGRNNWTEQTIFFVIFFFTNNIDLQSKLINKYTWIECYELKFKTLFRFIQFTIKIYTFFKCHDNIFKKFKYIA